MDVKKIIEENKLEDETIEKLRDRAEFEKGDRVKIIDAEGEERQRGKIKQTRISEYSAEIIYIIDLDEDDEYDLTSVPENLLLPLGG